MRFSLCTQAMQKISRSKNFILCKEIEEKRETKSKVNMSLIFVAIKSYEFVCTSSFDIFKIILE